MFKRNKKPKNCAYSHSLPTPPTGNMATPRVVTIPVNIGPNDSFVNMVCTMPDDSAEALKFLLDDERKTFPNLFLLNCKDYTALAYTNFNFHEDKIRENKEKVEDKMERAKVQGYSSKSEDKFTNALHLFTHYCFNRFDVVTHAKKLGTFVNTHHWNESGEDLIRVLFVRINEQDAGIKEPFKTAYLVSFEKPY